MKVESKTGEGSTTAETKFKQSYYAHDYLNKQGEFKNSKYYNLLFENENGDYFENPYWLAGRYVHLWKDYCDFGLHLVGDSSEDCYVHGSYTFRSNRCRYCQQMRASPASFYRSNVEWIQVDSERR